MSLIGPALEESSEEDDEPKIHFQRAFKKKWVDIMNECMALVIKYYNNCQGCDRIQPDILNAFKQNPYTQSLNSYY